MGSMGFTPIGEVVSGMDIVDRIYKVGEGAPNGPGPSQGLIQGQGNAYLDRAFPKLTYVSRVALQGAQGASDGNPQLETVHCELTTGPLTIEVHPEWAPIGSKRFLELVDAKYFDGCALFRAIKGFLVQFGIPEDGRLGKEWQDK